MYNLSQQTKADKAIACIFFVFSMITCGVLAGWIINFCVHYFNCLPSRCSRYHSVYKSIEVKMRRPFSMLFSYLLMIPWLGYQSWRNLNKREAESIQDLYEYFAFWFSFWCFIHIKFFRLWMIRYDFEYDKEMRNIEWKVDLGLRSIKPSSMIIRYRSLFGNELLMLCFQLIFVLLNIFTQILLRMLPTRMLDMAFSEDYEQCVILCLFIIELSVFIIIMYKEPMRAINDVHFVREEWIYFAKMCTALLSLYLFCLAIWFITAVYITPILVQCGALMMLNITLISFGYLDFVWIVKQVSKTLTPPSDKNKPHYSVPLDDVLECQDGFESMMRFLVGEYLCQNLLCYVECSLFVKKWSTEEELLGVHNDKNLYLPLIWSYIREQSKMFRVYVPDDITLLVLSYYKKLYVPLDVRCSMANKFLFFEPLVFESDTQHYRYLVQKYVAETANLKVLLSEKLKHKMLHAPYFEPNTNSSVLIDILNGVREELWDVISCGFIKYKESKDYAVLSSEFEPISNRYIMYKDVEYSVHLPPIPKVTDGEGENTVIDIKTA